MLPPPPPHTLLRDETPVPPGPPFLRVHRAMYRLRFANGETSEPFAYDVVDRARLDAVVIAAHFRGDDGRRHVYLRSALRPPVAIGLVSGLAAAVLVVRASGVARQGELLLAVVAVAFLGTFVLASRLVERVLAGRGGSIASRSACSTC